MNKALVALGALSTMAIGGAWAWRLSRPDLERDRSTGATLGDTCDGIRTKIRNLESQQINVKHRMVLLERQAFDKCQRFSGEFDPCFLFICETSQNAQEKQQCIEFVRGEREATSDMQRSKEGLTAARDEYGKLQAELQGIKAALEDLETRRIRLLRAGVIC